MKRRWPALLGCTLSIAACSAPQDPKGPSPDLVDTPVQPAPAELEQPPKPTGTGLARSMTPQPKVALPARKPRPPTQLPDLPFERYQLDNGLTVILHRDNRLPLVAVSVWYHVGAINERAGRSGFAHLFEHMMFQASPHVGEDQHFKILEQIGATGVNGTTEFDRTNYFETVPSNELETALWLESDRMGFLLASLTEKSLKNQIDVVQNERRQSVENAPYGLLEEQITKLLYPEPHPYFGDVIGSMKDIGAASLSDVQDFFQTYYTPANAVLTIAGDLDPAQTKALVQKYFGTLKGRPKPERPNLPMPALAGEKRLDWKEPVARLPKLSVVWPGPSAFSEDAAALDLLAYVLSGTRSSRLDKRVSYDDLIAQSSAAHFSEQLSGGRFSIDIVVRPGRTLDEAEKAVFEILDELEKKPPTWEELDRALNFRETSVVRGLEQLGNMGGRAEQLQLYQFYLGDPGKLAWDLGRYQAVTPEDVLRVKQKYLGKNRIVARATPAAAGAGQGAAE